MATESLPLQIHNLMATGAKNGVGERRERGVKDDNVLVIGEREGENDTASSSSKKRQREFVSIEECISPATCLFVHDAGEPPCSADSGTPGYLCGDASAIFGQRRWRSLQSKSTS